MSQDAIVQCDCCGGVVSPKSAKPESRVAELTDALTGMVRQFCDEDNGRVVAENSEAIAAVVLLAELGRVEITRDGRPVWLEGRWIGEEEPNAD